MSTDKEDFRQGEITNPQSPSSEIILKNSLETTQPTDQTPTTNQTTIGAAVPDVDNTQSNDDFCNLVSGIINSQLVEQELLQCTAELEACQLNPNLSQSISNTATTIKNINELKRELFKLNLDLTERDYYENRIVPLLVLIGDLASTSSSLAASADLLSKSIITHAKRSKIMDTIDLVYDINDDCEDIYKVLKHRIRFLLKKAKRK